MSTHTRSRSHLSPERLATSPVEMCVFVQLYICAVAVRVAAPLRGRERCGDVVMAGITAAPLAHPAATLSVMIGWLRSKRGFPAAVGGRSQPLVGAAREGHRMRAVVAEPRSIVTRVRSAVLRLTDAGTGERRAETQTRLRAGG